MKSITNLFILFLILIVLGFLYKRFEDKRIREEESDSFLAVQHYLLDNVTLGKSKKPILWIYVPHEYNARKWLSFGSRSSLELNQPYLYLTVRSIIKNCSSSFTICIIDDTTFQRLIPNWNINMNIVAEPILSNIRLLGLTKLLYIYGGLICPISFICLQNLIDLYKKGIRGNKMFVCDMINRNMTSSEYNFFPNLHFCGAPKNCEIVRELCNVIQRTTSHDFTADVRFLGEFDKWSKYQIEKGNINVIDSIDIGTKNTLGNQVIIDNLLSNYTLHLSPSAYGIYIPANEILMRRKFEWFARLSPKQVLESDTIIGNYLLLVTASDSKNLILEPLNNRINKEVTDKYVGYWKTPLYPGLWMVAQPNFLGDNIPRVDYTGR